MELKKYIKDFKINQKNLADSCDITVQAISQYANGRRKPRPDIANRIVKATKGAVSFADLYADRS